MSRVHCLECGNQVVVDPRGLCPEGHEVGSSGARIEHAMGHEVTHPDEPEPWVYSIDADEVTVPARPPAVGTMLAAPNGQSPAVRAAGAGSGAGPSANGSVSQGSTAAREARPVRAPGFADTPSEEGPADAESLLRELHSLAALDDALAEQGRSPGRAEGNGRAAYPAPAPAAAPPPPPEDATPPPPREAAQPAPTQDAGPEAADASTTEAALAAVAERATPRPTRADPSAIADAFAELSALDLPTAPSAGNGRAGGARARAATSPPVPGAATPPEAPTVPSADAGSAADGGGLSALFAEGPLFGEDDAHPAPGQRNGSTSHAAGGAARRDGAPAEREYEATLHVVPTRDEGGPAAAAGASRPQEASRPPTAPPPTPMDAQGRGRRRSLTGEDGTTTTDGHPVPAPEPGGSLDPTSFTARGGPGSGRTRGRRRRLAR